MSTQMYLMGGLVEGRVPSDRDMRQLRVVKDDRRKAREARRAQHQRNG